MKNVLVVIDLQVGFIKDKTVKVANNVRDLLDSGEYSVVIATKFTNMPGSSFDSFLGWKGLGELFKELGSVAEYAFKEFLVAKGLVE